MKMVDEENNVGDPVVDRETEQGLRLECPMCAAANAFEIDKVDPALGHCHVENVSWRITDKKCATLGCFQPKAAFGDLCMGCLAKAVDVQ